MDNLFYRNWDVPAYAYVLPVALAVLNISTWYAFSDDAGGMPDWGLSWQAIQSGRAGVLALHMFAHGGLVHLLINNVALVMLSPSLISRLGRPFPACARFTYLYIGSGLSGGLLFLLLSAPSAAMLGASGAIFGVLAAIARVHPETGAAVGIGSNRTWLLTRLVIQNHVALLVLLAVVALFTDDVGGVAWQSHLGGLLFGFFAAPLYLPRPS